MLAMRRYWPRERTNAETDARGGGAVTETTFYTPPQVLDPAAGSSGYLADIVANPPYSARPPWHAPTITRIDLTRTMAQCGSQQDWAGGEE